MLRLAYLYDANDSAYELQTVFSALGFNIPDIYSKFWILIRWVGSNSVA